MSELNFKDYVGYYIGCKVRHEFVTKTKNIELRDGTLTGIDTDGIVPCCWVRFNYNDRVRLDSIKPILRHLGSITDEECWQIDKIDSMWVPNTSNDYKAKRLHLYKERCMEFRNVSPLVFDYLLKQGFDLFSLIENSLAIDSNTLK